MIAGLGIFICALLLPMKLFIFCVLLPAVLATSFVPMIYSYVLDARLARTREPKENL